MALFRRWVTIRQGAPEVKKLAVLRANHRMQQEVLPYLSVRHPNPKSWYPLQSELKGPSAYGVKLRLPDMLVMEIMRDKRLMAKTEQIVVDETAEAAVIQGKAFVTSILDQLINE